jgi:hypothetical protein
MTNLDLINEIHLRLKGPTIALKRMAQGQYLPKVFVEASIKELAKACDLLNQLQSDKVSLRKKSNLI